MTLSPLDYWPSGARTLTVDASDLAGHPLLGTLTGSYDVPVTTTCGTAGGACVNATGTWTQTCVASHLNDQPGTSACIQANAVTSGCADCAAAYAFCAMASCGAQCTGGFSSAPCVACLGTSGCTATFTACGGRAP